MTSPEFWFNAASNAVGSTVGAAAGILAGLYLDRRRQRNADKKTARLNADTLRAAEGLIAERRTTVVGLLDKSFQTNDEALKYAENEVSQKRHLFTSGLDLQTWDVLKPQVVELIPDQPLVARLALHVAQLSAFDRAIDQRMRWPLSGFDHSEPIREFLIRLGPELRAHGNSLRRELRRFAA